MNFYDWLPDFRLLHLLLDLIKNKGFFCVFLQSFLYQSGSNVDLSSPTGLFNCISPQN